MSTADKFQGWLAYDKDAVEGKLAWGEYEPKPFEETDVDFQVTHCGICATDLHQIRGSFGPVMYPICVGHETVGKVVRVGSKASRFSDLSETLCVLLTTMNPQQVD